MSRFRRTWATTFATAGAILMLVSTALPASAQTLIDTGPATAQTNTKLPIVHHKGSGLIKPNPLNPHPVCNPTKDFLTVITQVSQEFKAVDSVEMANTTDKPIPVTQTVSRAHTLTLSLSGDIGGSFSGVKASIQPGISYQSSWNYGQTIGPYEVPAHTTARATYGWNVVKFSGTQQRCKLDGTWSRPWPYHGSAPSRNAVRVTTYSDPVDVVIDKIGG